MAALASWLKVVDMILFASSLESGVLETVASKFVLYCEL